jgi:hypothetical protein
MGDDGEHRFNPFVPRDVLQALMAAVSAAPGSTGAAGGAGVGVAVVSFFFFLFFVKGTPGPAQGEVWAGAAGVIC